MAEEDWVWVTGCCDDDDALVSPQDDVSVLVPDAEAPDALPVQCGEVMEAPEVIRKMLSEEKANMRFDQQVRVSLGVTVSPVHLRQSRRDRRAVRLQQQRRMRVQLRNVSALRRAGKHGKTPKLRRTKGTYAPRGKKAFGDQRAR